MIAWLVVALLLVGARCPGSARAAPALGAARPGEPPKVVVSLLSETAAIEPGTTFWVGLRQRIAPGWHTYWINAGDSGEPPTIEWSLPAGFAAGPIIWPRPERVPVEPFMSYGYTDEVVLLTQITAPRDLPAGRPVSLAGHAAWLVC